MLVVVFRKLLCWGGYFLRWSFFIWRLEISWFCVRIFLLFGKGVCFRCGDVEFGWLGEKVGVRLVRV